MGGRGFGCPFFGVQFKLDLFSERDMRCIERDEVDIRYLIIAGTADGAGEISTQDQLGVTPPTAPKAPVLKRKAIVFWSPNLKTCTFE